MILLAHMAPGASPASTVMHRHLRAEDGLVQSQVNTILEASDGMVWFGTFGGISRWDGTRFENYQLQDGLGGLDVRAFHETADGDILISTSDRGISRFRRGEFTVISTEQGLPAVGTRGFHRDDDGRLFVATADGLYVFADESLDLASAVHAAPGVRISGLAERQAGGFYISSFSHGILVWDGTGAVPLLPVEQLPNRIIRAVHELPDGTLLISVYRNGVWTWDGEVLAPFAHNGVLDSHDVMAFTPDGQGTLYLSTIGGGVAAWHGDTCEILDSDRGLADDTSWAAHVGDDGTVYIGTWDGVSIYHPGRTATLNAATGLAGSNITATAERPDGTMALAIFGGGVAFHDGQRVVRTLDTGDGLVNDRVWSLLSARDGSLYIGTHAGLNRWHDGELTTVFHEPDAPFGRVYGLHEQEDGTLWLATYGGIRVMRDGRPEELYPEPDSHLSTVYAVAETRDGALLFGTGGGLVTYHDGNVGVPTAGSPLHDLHVWAVHQRDDGSILLGTNGEGLWVLDDWRDKAPSAVVRKGDGLSEDTIFGIAEHAGGRFYLTTLRGVNVLTLGDGAPTIRQIHSTDGLAGEECSQGRCTIDSRGRVWICTIRGVTRYDPAQDPPVTRPPRMHWRQVRLFSDELPLASFAGTPEFGHRDNFFHFDFVAAYPRAPHRVKYRHRLTGVDRDWVEDRATSVAYNSLPPATYNLSVMASNGWGYWSEPISLDFRIRPPFWRTWWFILLAVLTGGGSVALLVLARVRHLLAYEQLRTKIAADLHDDIGAGLTEISIVSQVLERKLPPDQRQHVAEELDHLGEASRHLVRGMSDIVWLIHPQRDSLQDLIMRLADGYRSVFAAAGIDFRVENLDSLSGVRLGMAQRQHLYLIFKEAVNNVVKYSGCRELRLTAAVERGRLTMSLQDDGRGFDRDARNQGNGLRNMRERAAAIGGRLNVDTSPGGGCRITYRGR